MNSNKFILNNDNIVTNDTNYLENHKNKQIRKPIEGTTNKTKNQSFKKPSFYTNQEITDPFSPSMKEMK